MIIPKNIIQTSINRPSSYVQKMIKNQCVGWNYSHYNDSEILAFFSENPLQEFPKITEKFLSFSHGAHKADLFRYYYLFIKGGVYLDSDAMLEKLIESIIKNYEFISIKSYHSNRNLIFNGFIACTPQHPIIYEALKHIYFINDKNCNDDYFIICDQLYKIVSNYKGNNIYLYKEKKAKFYNISTTTYDSKNAILKHYRFNKTIPDKSKTKGSMLRNSKIFPKYLSNIITINIENLKQYLKSIL